MEANDVAFKLEGDVLFSPAERSLNGPDGSIVALTENNLRFLRLLLNGVTEKEEIINQVWKEQRGAISESSYYGQLYMLRKAFHQVGLKESLIRTIPRKGVKYTGSVSKVMSQSIYHSQGIAENKEIHQGGYDAPFTSIQSQSPNNSSSQRGAILSPSMLSSHTSTSKGKGRRIFEALQQQHLLYIVAVVSIGWFSFLLAMILFILTK